MSRLIVIALDILSVYCRQYINCSSVKGKHSPFQVNSLAALSDEQ